MPFPVRAIQVDGGSEFKAEFETACAAKGITLYELPPKRPQLNGAVERCNSAWRYEFYAVYDLPSSIDALNPILDRAAFWRWMEAILRAATGIAPSGEPKGHGPVPQG